MLSRKVHWEFISIIVTSLEWFIRIKTKTKTSGPSGATRWAILPSRCPGPCSWGLWPCHVTVHTPGSEVTTVQTCVLVFPSSSFFSQVFAIGHMHSMERQRETERVRNHPRRWGMDGPQFLLLRSPFRTLGRLTHMPGVMGMARPQSLLHSPFRSSGTHTVQCDFQATRLGTQTAVSHVGRGPSPLLHLLARPLLSLASIQGLCLPWKFSHLF